MRASIHLAILAGFLLLLPSCGGGGGTLPTRPDLIPLRLVQVDSTDMDAAGIWDPEDGIIDGDTAPTRAIGGPTNAVIEGAFGVHRDSRGDTLIVGDIRTPTIRFWDGVGSLSGDVAPTRVLTGANTQITNGNAYEVHVDESRDLLYVAHQNGVFVFANAATIDGDVAPVRSIAGAATGLMTGTRDKRLFVDEANDRLYVSDLNAASVFVWDNASTVDGNTAPSRTIAGANTGFVTPWGVAVDVGRDILYVADWGLDKISVFDGASTLDGNVAPNRTISDLNSTLDAPSGIDVDAQTDRLYVSHLPGRVGAVSIWHDASTADGDPAPTRTLVGAATGIESNGDVHVSR